MKKFFTLFISSTLFVSAFAQITEGFYRVKNVASDRYVYVCDDKGVADVVNGNVKTDLGAIYLRKNLEYAISDPGSIIFIDQTGVSDGVSYYNLLSQGTSVYSIIKHNVNLNKRGDYYGVGATVQGVSAYLADNSTSNAEYVQISTDSNNANQRLWNPIPVAVNSDNYFGVKPSVSAGDKFYESFYASFGFKPVSDATKVYSATSVCEAGAVFLSEVTGEVPPASPVIIECQSDSPSNNKLDLKTGSSKLESNKLKGVYFNVNTSDKKHPLYLFSSYEHKNQKEVTDNIRILTVNAAGKLVFAKSSLSTIPANSSYLEVSASAADELEVYFDKDAYDQFVVNSLESLTVDTDNHSVYNLLGKKIQYSRNLPAGIYIIDGKKTVIR